MSEQVRFIHLRPCDKTTGDIKHYGGYTLAYVSDDSSYKVAISKCHKGDSFKKKMGITISKRRLEKGKIIELEKPSPATSLMAAFVAGLSEPAFASRVSKYSYKDFMTLVKERRVRERNAQLKREQDGQT